MDGLGLQVAQEDRLSTPEQLFDETGPFGTPPHTTEPTDKFSDPDHKIESNTIGQYTESNGKRKCLRKAFNHKADDKRKHKIMKSSSKIHKGKDPYLPMAEPNMRNVINRMQSTLVAEESSVEDSVTLEEVPLLWLKQKFCY